MYIYPVYGFLVKIKNSISTTLNLVRAELFFGACFAQFYALLLNVFSDLQYSQTIVNIYSIVFVIVLLVTYIKPALIKTYRIVSNSLYLFASIYILFVAFINDYDKAAFFLVLFNYVVVSFSMPNIKILGVLSAFFYWTFFMSYFLLDFEAETPFWVTFGSLFFISIASFFIVFARNVYKNRIKERELLLDHLFNYSNDGLLLVNKKDLLIKDCNLAIQDIFKIPKKNIIGKNILRLELKNKFPFEHLKSLSKETIEFDSKELIHYQKKEIEYLKYSYLLVQVKKFKNRGDMNHIFRFSKL